MKKSTTSKAARSRSSHESAKPSIAVRLIRVDVEVGFAVLQLARAYELVESSLGRLIEAVDSTMPLRSNRERVKAADALIQYARKAAADGMSTSSILDPSDDDSDQEASE